MAAMEATLKIAACPFWKGTFLYSTPLYRARIKSMCEAVLKLLSRNQIQDGCSGRHIGYRIALNIERNLPLNTPIISHNKKPLKTVRPDCKAPTQILFMVITGKQHTKLQTCICSHVSVAIAEILLEPEI